VWEVLGKPVADLFWRPLLLQFRPDVGQQLGAGEQFARAGESGAALTTDAQYGEGTRTWIRCCASTLG
jgi:hypothetical protein